MELLAAMDFGTALAEAVGGKNGCSKRYWEFRTDRSRGLASLYLAREGPMMLVHVNVYDFGEAAAEGKRVLTNRFSFGLSRGPVDGPARSPVLGGILETLELNISVRDSKGEFKSIRLVQMSDPEVEKWISRSNDLAASEKSCDDWRRHQKEQNEFFAKLCEHATASGDEVDDDEHATASGDGVDDDEHATASGDGVDDDEHATASDEPVPLVEGGNTVITPELLRQQVAVHLPAALAEMTVRYIGICCRCGRDGDDKPKWCRGLIACGRELVETGRGPYGCGRPICFSCAQRRRDRPCVDLCDYCVIANRLSYTGAELASESGAEAAHQASLAADQERETERRLAWLNRKRRL